MLKKELIDLWPEDSSHVIHRILPFIGINNNNNDELIKKLYLALELEEPIAFARKRSIYLFLSKLHNNDYLNLSFVGPQSMPIVKNKILHQRNSLYRMTGRTTSGLIESISYMLSGTDVVYIHEHPSATKYIHYRGLMNRIISILGQELIIKYGKSFFDYDKPNSAFSQTISARSIGL